MSDSIEEIALQQSIIRNQWLPLDMAVQEIVSFERRFGEKHFLLACHAALPSLLTPELLHLIRLNFLTSKQLSAPLIAEMDFLLSPLCHPMGDTLFEVEPMVREALLFELQERYSWQRLQEIAVFLLQYLQKKPENNRNRGIAQLHEWIAQSYLQPDKVVEELQNLLIKSLNAQSDNYQTLSQKIQIARTMELLAEPLERTTLQEEYYGLIHSTRVLAYTLYGNRNILKATTLSEQTTDKPGVPLFPYAVQQWIRTIAPSQITSKKVTFYEQAQSIVSQEEINTILWMACDIFRGSLEPSEYKNYILVMLFLKYISDLWNDDYTKYQEQFNINNYQLMVRKRLVLPEGCDFDSLYNQRAANNIGELINVALNNIEEANREKLKGAFHNIDFNLEAKLGATKERDSRLQQLLEAFADSRLDLRPSRLGNLEIPGKAYEYLIARFAPITGIKSGEIYTPSEVSELLVKLLDPQPGERICDPICGSGSLLIRCAHHIGNKNFALYGQENSDSMLGLSKLNMLIHGIDNARIEYGDTLREPLLIKDGRLMQFEVVIANPPFSLNNWGAEEASNDRFRRFHRGIPPKSKGDYAFIQHIIETTDQHKGRAGVIMAHGVLFRGNSEAQVRKKLIEENLLDAVIGLPSNLFYGTGIPAIILLFRRNKSDNTVVFIDASHEVEVEASLNKLRAADIKRIVNAYQTRATIEQYCYVATNEEIAANDFNLNITSYIKTSSSIEFLRHNWCGLQWTPWISFSSPDIRTLPTGPGVYRIKAIGIDELFYIGQTGRNLQERLTALIRNTLDDPEQMPFNDPHTAAPSLWAWRDAEGLDFECSVASVPTTLSTEKREAFESSLLWRYRLEHGSSTRCNYGRFHPGYIKSRNRVSGFRGGKLPEREINPAWGPSYPALPFQGVPQDEHWMALEWSPLTRLHVSMITSLPEQPGICKLLDQDNRLVLVELDQNIQNLLARFCRRPWRSSDIQFSVVTFASSTPPYQLREIKNDLIGGYYRLTRQPPLEQQRFN